VQRQHRRNAEDKTRKPSRPSRTPSALSNKYRVGHEASQTSYSAKFIRTTCPRDIFVQDLPALWHRKLRRTGVQPCVRLRRHNRQCSWAGIPERDSPRERDGSFGLSVPRPALAQRPGKKLPLQPSAAQLTRTSKPWPCWHPPAPEDQMPWPNMSVEARPNGKPPGPVWRYAYIFASPGLAPCRRRRLTSNVRRHPTSRRSPLDPRRLLRHQTAPTLRVLHASASP